MSERWREVWRAAVTPLLSTPALKALREALASDDPRLLQGATTSPPHLFASASDWPVEKACALGFCGWQGDGLKTIGEVEEFFARLCFNIDANLNEPAGCRWWLNWFDETPREAMRAELLPEVERSLRLRKETQTNGVSSERSELPA